MNELALFAGAGGGILGGKLLGWRTVCAVESDPYAAYVLAQRQNDGVLPSFPIWDYVQTFDGRAFRGIIDVVSGGFPCQDISRAGRKKGIGTGKREGGTKSSLWFHMLRIIEEVQPKYVFIENSSELRTRGLDQVLGGLAAAGYNAAWGVLSAKDCGAPHERKRMWIVATHPDYQSTFPQGGKFTSIGKNSCNPDKGEVWKFTGWRISDIDQRVDDGLAFKMDRRKAIGNGQVPIVGATAFTQLVKVLEEHELQ